MKDGYTVSEIMEGAKQLAQAYKRGDDPCMGFPRSDVAFVNDNFAYYAPYIPLHISPPLYLLDREKG